MLIHNWINGEKVIYKISGISEKIVKAIFKIVKQNMNNVHWANFLCPCNEHPILENGMKHTQNRIFINFEGRENWDHCVEGGYYNGIKVMQIGIPFRETDFKKI